MFLEVRFVHRRARAGQVGCRYAPFDGRFALRTPFERWILQFTQSFEAVDAKGAVAVGCGSVFVNRHKGLDRESKRCLAL